MTEVSHPLCGAMPSWRCRVNFVALFVYNCTYQFQFVVSESFSAVDFIYALWCLLSIGDFFEYVRLILLCGFLVCNLLLDSFFVVSFEYVRLICVVLWVYQTHFVVLVFVFVRLFAGQRHQSYSFGTPKTKTISDREINDRVNFTFTQYFRIQKHMYFICI